MPELGLILNLSWGAFALVWLLGTFRIKPDVSDNGCAGWLRPGFARVIFAIAVIAAVLVFRRGYSPADYSETLLFRPGAKLAWAAATLTIAGIGLAIWARIHLGRNWSPRPSRKQGHELV